jgi:hypothetical protein
LKIAQLKFIDSIRNDNQSVTHAGLAIRVSGMAFGMIQYRKKNEHSDVSVSEFAISKADLDVYVVSSIRI